MMGERRKDLFTYPTAVFKYCLPRDEEMSKSMTALEVEAKIKMSDDDVEFSYKIKVLDWKLHFTE